MLPDYQGLPGILVRKSLSKCEHPQWLNDWMTSGNAISWAMWYDSDASRLSRALYAPINGIIQRDDFGRETIGHLAKFRTRSVTGWNFLQGTSRYVSYDDVAGIVSTILSRFLCF